jgi:hypothetical protein
LILICIIFLTYIPSDVSLCIPRRFWGFSQPHCNTIERIKIVAAREIERRNLHQWARIKSKTSGGK